jgi:hypothetical protein
VLCYAEGTDVPHASIEVISAMPDASDDSSGRPEGCDVPCDLDLITPIAVQTRVVGHTICVVQMFMDAPSELGESLCVTRADTPTKKTPEASVGAEVGGHCAA